jgi:hypothetical protein
MDVTMPDGTVIQDVPDGTTQAQLSAKYKAHLAKLDAPQAAPAFSPEVHQVYDKLPPAPTGLVEGAFHMASQVPAFVGAGLASAYQLATAPAGLKVRNARQAAASAQTALTYQPRSTAGQAIAGATDTVLGLIPKGADYVGTKAQQGLEAVGVNPKVAAGVGGGVSTLLQAGPSLLGAKGGAAAAAKLPALTIPDALKSVARNPETEQAIAAATSAGYKLTPTQAGGAVGKTVEGVTGQAALERRLSRQNAETTDTLARKSIGMDKLAPLTSDGFATLKRPANAAYAEVAKTGQVAVDDAFKADVAKIGDRSGAGSFPEDTPAAVANLKANYGKLSTFNAADAVAKVRQLRADAVKNQKAINAPEQNALGYAQRQIAEALDNQLERHAQGLGLNDVVQNLRDARVQLAKIHTVEAATEGNHVSAARIFKQGERGVPLSGELKTIADAYGSFSKSLQDVGKIRNSGPFSVVDYLLGAGAAIHNPAMAGAILARPLARGFLSSDLYQNALRRDLNFSQETYPQVGPRNALSTPRRATL